MRSLRAGRTQPPEMWPQAHFACSSGMSRLEAGPRVPTEMRTAIASRFASFPSPPILRISLHENDA